MDIDRQYIKHRLSTNIQKYEQEKNLEREQQERAKLNIKKQILEQLMSRQKQTVGGSPPGSPAQLPQPESITPPPASTDSQLPTSQRRDEQFSYSFGDRQNNTNNNNSSSDNTLQQERYPNQQADDSHNYYREEEEYQHPPKSAIVRQNSRQYTHQPNREQYYESEGQSSKRSASDSNQNGNSFSREELQRPKSITNLYPTVLDQESLELQRYRQNVADTDDQNPIVTAKWGGVQKLGGVGSGLSRMPIYSAPHEQQHTEIQPVRMRNQYFMQQKQAPSRVQQQDPSLYIKPKENILDLFPSSQFRPKSPFRKESGIVQKRMTGLHSPAKSGQSSSVHSVHGSDSRADASYNRGHHPTQEQWQQQSNNNYDNSNRGFSNNQSSRASQQERSQVYKMRDRSNEPSYERQQDFTLSKYKNRQGTERIKNNSGMVLNKGQSSYVSSEVGSSERSGQQQQLQQLRQQQQQLIQQPQQQQPKTIKLDVKNDDPQDEQRLENLKRKKIEEMEKRRQKRNEDKAAQLVANKSIDKDRERQRQRDETQTNQSGSQYSSYSAIHRRIDKLAKQYDELDLKPDNNLQIQQPPKPSKSPPKPMKATPDLSRVRANPPFQQYERGSEERRSVSPHGTPKTIATNKTSKTSFQKQPTPSIFEDNTGAHSPGRSREKLLRYAQEPKIEPKDRKITFAKQSNKKIMMNAISLVCLPGELNRKEREKLLEVMENDPNEFFIFLFKEYSRKVIKAIYSYDSQSERVRKVYGEKAPAELFSENVQEFYRYDSGAKEFKVLDGCKSFSYAVHAVFIK